MIIGLGHKKRHGKSTAAKIITRDWDFKEYTFAAPIKEVVEIVFAFPARLQTSLKEEIWPPVGISYRAAMQKIGQSFKDSFGEKFWVKTLERKVLNEALTNRSPEHVVISDVRHLVEAEWIKSQDGILIRIHNPNIDLEDSHISETSLEGYTGWDYEIANDKSINHLEHQIDRILIEIFDQKKV